MAAGGRGREPGGVEPAVCGEWRGQECLVEAGLTAGPSASWQAQALSLHEEVGPEGPRCP